MDPAITRYLHVVRIENDDESLFENRIWVPDTQFGYRLCAVIDEGISDVLVGFRDEQGFFEKKRVERDSCEPTSRNSLGNNLCNLSEPNNATVLDSLSRRYQHGVIHTYSGLFCVVINPWKNIPIYSEEVMEEYKTDLGEQAPHVFSVAQEAYDGIMRGGRNQSILITGESGAGKTENTKKIIDYILHSSGSNSESSIGKDVVTTGVLLEAFGNARTSHNNNSSRFGKFIRIDFDKSAKLQAAKIESYLLEKSRVVSQNEGDRNFHIFYQLFSEELPQSVRDNLNLSGIADDYKFLNQGGICREKDIDDASQALETYKAMEQLGITEDERLQVYQLAAASMLIGEIKFGERQGMDLSFVESQKEVDKVAALLKLKTSRIVDALTSPTIRVGEKLIRKNQNLKKTQFSASAMAKVIYERLFSWLVQKCNAAITPKHIDDALSEECRFIGVLDIAGFEIMQKNSFEQFCINFTNEKLQQFFNHFMFVKEQAEYEEEGIEWQHLNYANDLQPTVDLIEKPMGIMALLDEECVMPNGSDTSLLEKFCSNFAQSKVFSKIKTSIRNKAVVHFTVKHYAGDVNYNIDAWIEKNRDVVETSVLRLLSESTLPLVQELFPTLPNESLQTRRGTLCQASSVTYVYKNQLQSLLDSLNQTSAHFVRCVVPNYERIPGKIDGNLVLHQLRCNGVLEGIRICRKGYPTRLPFNEFIRRYSILAGVHFDGQGKQGCKTLLERIGLDKDRYQVGATKLFCKVGVISELENCRKNWLTNMITSLQSHIRSNIALRDSHEKVKKLHATLVIQSNVRTFSDVSQWPWFRLMTLVRPLIPKDRELIRIQELEAMIKKLEAQTSSKIKENEKLTNELARLQLERLQELERLRKEKTEMEDRWRKKVEDVTSDYQARLSQSEKELSDLKRGLQKKVDESLADYKNRLQEAEEKNRRLEKEKEKGMKAVRSELDQSEKKISELQLQLDKINAAKDKEMKKLEAEMQQNEDIFTLLEKKYNEQHKNVLKLNDTLRDYERRLDDAEMNKSDLEKLLKRANEALERETSEKTALQKEHEGCAAVISEMEARIQRLLDEIASLKLNIASLENESEDGKLRTKRQNDTISDMQKLITELTEKVNRFDMSMLAEKNKRRAVEKERDRLEDKLKSLQDHHDKLKKKYDQLKDQLRQHDNAIKSMEKKLEDKDAIMQDCMKDLKENHKARLSEMEEKIDEYKRRNSKLESQNSLQQFRLESFDRESSVDSDYGRSSCTRLSTIGRHNSLTSCSSFSSFRTLNRRRETEPDLASSIYLPRRQNSITDLSTSYSMQRSSSNSNIEKDRKISELERQIQTLNTDINIQRREVEVYKASLNALEMEKEHLSNQNRTQSAELENLRRQLERAEMNSDTLALRLKKALEDAEQWKKRHEDLIQETKNEILVERKRASDRLEATRQEQEMKLSRIQQAEESREDLQHEYHRCQAELDRALATIHQMEGNLHSQEFLGDSLEHTHRELLSELEAVKEENDILKSRLRRQSKQIELLTQQDSTSDIMNHIQSKLSS